MTTKSVINTLMIILAVFIMIAILFK